MSANGNVLAVALLDLDRIAREQEGHVTLHADYGPNAQRHPEPDWSCQLVFTATARFPDGDKPHVFNWYGTGRNPETAIAEVLRQVYAAIEASPPGDTP